MTPSVREATHADAPALAGLLTELGYPSSEQDVRERLTYWLDDAAGAVLVAEDAETVLGCVVAYKVPYFERTGRWCRVVSLVVTETVRGSGAGRILLEAAEDTARGWGCTSVELTCSRTRERAHAFYRHLGYADVSDRSGRFWKPLG